MVKKSLNEPDKIVLIRYLETNSPSYTLHFSIYPHKTIEKVGTLNVFYFMRSDDYEYSTRILSLNPKMYILENLKYTHPLIKGKSYNSFFDYLAKRNTMLFFIYNRNMSYFKNFLVVSFVSILNSLFYFIKEKNKLLILLIYYSIFDFLTFPTDPNEIFKLNLKRKEELIKNKKLIEGYQLMSQKEINNILKHSKTLSPNLSKILNIEIGFSFNKFVSVNYYYPFYFLNKITKKCILILESDNNKYTVLIKNNPNLEIIKNIILVLILILPSFLLFFMYISLFYLGTLINKIK